MSNATASAAAAVSAPEKAAAKAAAKPAIAPVPASPRPQRMLGKNFQLAAFRFNRWSAELDENQELEQCLAPDFWALQAETLIGHDKSKPKGVGDIIEVRKRDSGLYAELLVTEIGAGFIKTAVIGRFEPEAIALPQGCPLVTRWNAGKKSHDVIRAADNALMQSGFQTKTAAVAWIADHLRKLGG